MAFFDKEDPFSSSSKERHYYIVFVIIIIMVNRITLFITNELDLNVRQSINESVDVWNMTP
jgi:hypothetical protein